MSTSPAEIHGWWPEIAFGDRLRIVRRKRNRSQTEMATLLDIKQGRYATWEAGTATPSHEEILRVARRLQMLDGVPVVWTLGAYDSEPVAAVRVAEHAPLAQLAEQLTLNQRVRGFACTAVPGGQRPGRHSQRSPLPRPGDTRWFGARRARPRLLAAVHGRRALTRAA